MRVALDTNVLVYAEGIGDARRCDQAIELVERLDAHEVLLPAQTLGELHRVLTVKGARPAADAREAVLGWIDSFEVAGSSTACFVSAFDLCADHGLQIWDALVCAVAAEHRCRVLLTEDLQAGFTWRGLTVVDPFARSPHPLLTDLLAG